MGIRKLAGAALQSHLAKEAGARLPLRGAALAAHLVKQRRVPVLRAFVALDDDETDDGPLEEEPVTPEEKAPWYGRLAFDGNFVPDDSEQVAPSVVGEFNLLDERIDGEESSLSQQERYWAGVEHLREERKRIRKLRKELGRRKLKDLLTRAHFAATVIAEAASSHREVTKQDLHKFLRGEVERKPLPKKLRGDPGNIPAARKWVEDHFPKQAQG